MVPDTMHSTELIIRPFEAADQAKVLDLFVRVSRLLAPPERAADFEAYIARSISEEISRIDSYYKEHQGAYFVALTDNELVGMFGLEGADGDAMELRRMYVDPDWRRQGIARVLLDHAENEARWRGKVKMVLSTSELQQAALWLYRSAGYVEVAEDTPHTQSNKVMGGGLKRYHFKKYL